MSVLKPPAQSMIEQLADVDEQLRMIYNRDLPATEVAARTAVAQVKAICALAHAIRDLTEAVRQTS